MTADHLPPPTDPEWHHQAARGEIRTEAAFRFVRSMNAQLDQLKVDHPELHRSMVQGNIDHPDDPRRDTSGTLGPATPAEPPDPAVANLLDRNLLAEVAAEQVAQHSATGTEGAPVPRRRARKSATADVVPLLRPIDGEDSIRYTLAGEQRGLWRAGERGAKRLTGWCPEVVRHLVRLDDDGQPVERGYVVRCTPEGAEVVVGPEGMRTGKCWDDLAPDATGMARRALREALYNCVLQQAVDLERATWLLRRSGWVTSPDGDWRYRRLTDPAAGVEVRYQRQAIMERRYRPAELLDDAAVVERLAAMAGRGWGPIVGAGAGLRALFNSLARVAVGVVVTGQPASGKSLTEWAGLCPVMHPGSGSDDHLWPPYADGSFGDTSTAIELKLEGVADRLGPVEDLPLTADSAGYDDRSGAKLLDGLYRPYANDLPMRDRGQKSLTLRESHTIRAVPIATAQRLPTSVQASLLRRMVLVELLPGDNDVAWYSAPEDEGAGGGELVAPALRTLGEHMIARAEQLGPEVVAELVLAADRRARVLLRPAYVEAVGDDGQRAEMALPLQGAAQLVAGWLLVEALTGDDAGRSPFAETVGHLVAELLPPLAASLARQARHIVDRQAADTGTDHAVADVLRRAFALRRATVYDRQTGRPCDLVPGQTRPAQGLPVALDDDRGDGRAVWWIADRGVHGTLGISTGDLHALVRDDGDPRLAGRIPETLARHLVAEGVALPSHQQRTSATAQVRAGGRNRHLVLVRAEVVYDLDDGPEPPELPPEPAAPEPEPPPTTDDGAGPPSLPLDEPAPAAQRPVEPPEATPAPEHHAGPSTPTSAAQRPRPGPASAAPPAAMVVVDVKGIGVRAGGPEGAWVFHEGAGAGDLTAVMAGVAELAPEGRAIVLVGEDVHRRLGLRDTAPGPNTTRAPAAFRRLTEAGWHRPGHPGQPPKVTQHATMELAGRPGMVWLLPVAWLSGYPRLGDDDDAPPLDLADRLAEWREVVGCDLEGTTAATGARMLRDRLATARRTPLWNPRLTSWPTPVYGVRWSRPLDAGEAGATHVLGWDGVRNYLPAIAQAMLAPGDLTHHEHPRFDPKLAGYWLVRAPAWPHPLVPPPLVDPTGRPVEAGREVWATTARLRLYADVGVPLDGDPLESLTARRSHMIGQRQLAEHLAAILDDPATPEHVADGVKRLYQSLHGYLRHRQHIVGRPDWGHAVLDEAWCGLLRKVYAGAGLALLPDRVTGGVPRHTSTPRWPVKVNVDAVYYAGTEGDDAPESFRVAEHLGGFRLESMTPVADWPAVTP